MAFNETIDTGMPEISMVTKQGQTFFFVDGVLLKGVRSYSIEGQTSSVPFITFTIQPSAIVSRSFDDEPGKKNA